MARARNAARGQGPGQRKGHATSASTLQLLQHQLPQLAGQLALAYKVFRCWVSEFQSLPELDAQGNAVAIQTIKLENEGWERDVEVPEPSEPALT